MSVDLNAKIFISQIIDIHRNGHNENKYKSRVHVYIIRMILYSEWKNWQ